VTASPSPPSAPARPKGSARLAYPRRGAGVLAVRVCAAAALTCAVGCALSIAAGAPPAGQLGLLAALCLSAATVGVAASRHHRGELSQALRLARTDDLTGLANRRAFVAAVEEALAARAPVAAMLLDLDGFKAINDTYGHRCGNQVLVASAHRLRAVTGPDGLVARLGGDEFAVLTYFGDPGRLLDLAHAVRADLLRPVSIRPGAVVVRASVGIAVRGAGPEAPADLLHRADVAMYEAKQGLGVVLAGCAGPVVDRVGPRREGDGYASAEGGRPCAVPCSPTSTRH
jgi:diguanylate cyclase (GGDEF)-like protein